MTVSRRAFRAVFAAIGVSLALTAGVAAASAPADESWPALKRDLFQNREISENSDLVSLQTPMKAEDAALVPLTMSVRQPQGDLPRVVKMSLVIDENPAPLAGTFTLGEKGGVVQIATRVRVNADTYIHLVAELSDGSLTESKRYVFAAGGCSAPSTKTLDALGASLGQLKFNLLPDLVHSRRAAVVMIRHPNFTGMQMDESTHDYTPARYVDHFAVYQDDDLVFSVDGGISISEDPNFRFAFAAGSNRTLRIEASDNSGARFTSSWPILASGG
jgi:sulfur-oxidizing protein SoxY